MKGAVFSPSELLSSFSEFKKTHEKKNDKLSEDVKIWLREWLLYDLAVSPMDDKERSFIRYGHYLGWFSYQSKGKE